MFRSNGAVGTSLDDSGAELNRAVSNISVYLSTLPQVSVTNGWNWDTHLQTVELSTGRFWTPIYILNLGLTTLQSSCKKLI